MSFEDTLDRHNDHEVVIVPKKWKNKTDLVPGLYCDRCRKLIKWLSLKEAIELKKEGVIMRNQLRKSLDNTHLRKIDTTWVRGGWK
jgi:hypothetical protein